MYMSYIFLLVYSVYTCTCTLNTVYVYCIYNMYMYLRLLLWCALIRKVGVAYVEPRIFFASTVYVYVPGSHAGSTADFV